MHLIYLRFGGSCIILQVFASLQLILTLTGMLYVNRKLFATFINHQKDGASLFKIYFYPSCDLVVYRERFFL